MLIESVHHWLSLSLLFKSNQNCMQHEELIGKKFSWWIQSISLNISGPNKSVQRTHKRGRKCFCFIWQDVKPYTIKITTQSSNINTISDILLCDYPFFVFFLRKKSFRYKGLNFSCSPWKSISVQQINNKHVDE